MIGSKDQFEKVFSPVHESQSDTRLSEIVCEECQVNVAVDSFVVVHTQHSLAR